MRRGALVTALAALVLASSAHAVQPPSFADGAALHVVAVKQLSPRLFELRLTTPLLTAPTNVQILLPADYDANQARRFPVLYLFHGTSGGARDWTKMGDAEQTTSGRALITVMPDAAVESNGGGWFTDWVNGGRFGPPQWETWHIRHLIPWIDQHLRTIADRRGRAIIGLSQGGFGAMSYATRHPDLFGIAGTFSGAVDISANPLIAVPLVTPVVNATEVGLNGVPPNTFFGDRATNEINWAAHDPATLAGNLRATSLYAYTGNGNLGPLDPPGPNLGASAVEAGVHELTTLFHGELLKRGIPIDYHDYGAGTHTWPYWARDLRDVMPALMHDFEQPAAPPATIDYESADDPWSQWGWDVDPQRPAREFSALLRAGPRGFTLRGSGRATVRTPAVYRPGAPATVTITAKDARTEKQMTVADDGRLRMAVPLGPGNPVQQFRLGATTRFYDTRVTIDAPPCPTTLRVRLAGTIRSARATLGRRRLPARRTAHTATVSLAGLAAGAQRVRITVLMRSGERRVLRRSVRTC
jgi:S-formylglutathione hydrolase FrmB